MLDMIILDDHPLVRQGIRMIISSGNCVRIVGEASNSQEALMLMNEKHPHMVLVDLNLGSESGLHFIQEAKKAGHLSKFMILTSSATRSELNLAQTLQVEGLCLKEALPEDLLYAVDVVSRGRKYYDPAFTDYLLDPKEDSDFSELTPKELEVLIALGRGHSNKEIALELFISEFTVKKHVSQILMKLNVTDRTKAALYASSKGLVQYERREESMTI
ncbi:nitrate/nitrite response regulator protein narL [Paenibacillus swuensis]|uniref:Nitrate/nitrite response regulator protein narL n=1 Tax=Paenibacillus swuensis TaxID=1178515 RepID=A0A172THH4_9BACL|nr:response regulator transcription factor [Paenibacillus swuensis]ANE46508.1 nitrate/nitrite response regulator protein narL [Paenibacillus swuensis]